PPGASVMPVGPLLTVGAGISVIIGFADVAVVGIRPILLPANSVNHSALSGPTEMLSGELLGVGMANSVTTCVAGSIRPMLAAVTVNQSAPSGPAVMSKGRLLAVSTGKSVIAGFAGVAVVGIRPILLASGSVNQSAPSGPAVMPASPLLAVGTWNSVIAPAV